MSRLTRLSSEIAAAEGRILFRRLAVRRQTALLAARARRRLASPIAIFAAAGAGYLLASRTGRRGLGKLFSVAQLALAALSAVKAAK